MIASSCGDSWSATTRNKRRRAWKATRVCRRSRTLPPGSDNTAGNGRTLGEPTGLPNAAAGPTAPGSGAEAAFRVAHILVIPLPEHSAGVLVNGRDRRLPAATATPAAGAKRFGRERGTPSAQCRRQSPDDEGVHPRLPRTGVDGHVYLRCRRWAHPAGLPIFAEPRRRVCQLRADDRTPLTPVLWELAIEAAA